MKGTSGEEIIVPAPWPVLTLLPRGLELSGDRAPGQDRSTVDARPASQTPLV
ncbi:Uncharacterised protein [Mycobacteroides abscessus]|uniref:Uncharacterized protein n=1 Tax=Mycobacteroides abscessus TaxID=36809 RepID=A0A0U0ZRJ9_9MYCO|nr:Uncharacterised protein [Mycobacteroides abscessus]